MDCGYWYCGCWIGFSHNKIVMKVELGVEERIKTSDEL
jgi:hypothetical protein